MNYTNSFKKSEKAQIKTKKVEYETMNYTHMCKLNKIKVSINIKIYMGFQSIFNSLTVFHYRANYKFLEGVLRLHPQTLECSLGLHPFAYLR